MNAMLCFIIGFLMGALAQPLVDHCIKSHHTDWDESPGGYTVIDEWHGRK